MKVPKEDQIKMFQMIEKDKETYIEMFRNIISYKYPEGTKCIVIYMDDVDFGFGFMVNPHKDPYNEIGGLVGSGSVSFETLFDDDELFLKGLFVDYMNVAEKIYWSYLSYCFKQTPSHENFHLPIFIMHDDKTNKYFDIRTETYHRTDDYYKLS